MGGLKQFSHMPYQIHINGLVEIARITYTSDLFLFMFCHLHVVVSNLLIDNIGSSFCIIIIFHSKVSFKGSFNGLSRVYVVRIMLRGKK